MVWDIPVSQLRSTVLADSELLTACRTWLAYNSSLVKSGRRSWSLLDSKAASELKFTCHFLHNLPKISCLSAPPSQINFLFLCYDQKAAATIIFLPVLERAERLHSLVEWTIHPKKQISQHFLSIQLWSTLFSGTQLPRLSPCFCCWLLPQHCQ